MNQFTKLDSAGNALPADATGHVAVLDAPAGLIWLVAPASAKRLDHADATKAVAALDAMGETDWRLPTRAELLTLVDDTRHDPAIDVDTFPGTASDWHWTSTPAAWSPRDYAWFVDFDGGGADDSRRVNLACVRAVRSVAPASGQ